MCKPLQVKRLVLELSPWKLVGQREDLSVSSVSASSPGNINSRMTFGVTMLNTRNYLSDAKED